MQKKYLEIGKIVSTHGIRGELRVQPWCDSPDFFKQFKYLYLDENGEKKMKVVSCRPQPTIVLLKLDSIDTVEHAALLRNKVLYMNRRDAKIDKGSYFVQDLIDCTVVDADDKSHVYGTLSDVSVTGANDVWHIAKDGKEYLIPAIPDVVDDVDVKKGIITIRPLKGIFDDEN